MNSKGNPTQSNGKPKWLNPFRRALLINLGIMIVAAFFLMWLALKWLDVWTAHGEYEVVPEVKGLSYNLAVSQLESMGFTVELMDSIYDGKSRPGTIVEQNPKQGTKVKSGRVVYITIVAFSPKQVVLPMLSDVSERQARSILEGLGIKNIRTVNVPGEYRDLVMSAKYNGVALSPGTRVPVTATITLEVAEGQSEEIDSIMMVEDLVPSAEMESTGSDARYLD